MNRAPKCLRITGRSVCIEYIHPPIPIRQFDYCATFDPMDVGDPQGYGASSLEAAADLKEKAEELLSRRDDAPDYRTAEQYYADQAHARKRKLLETGE